MQEIIDEFKDPQIMEQIVSLIAKRTGFPPIPKTTQWRFVKGKDIGRSAEVLILGYELYQVEKKNEQK